eukprot:4047311-Prymnesium_polylepis.1
MLRLRRDGTRAGPRRAGCCAMRGRRATRLRCTMRCTSGSWRCPICSGRSGAGGGRARWATPGRGCGGCKAVRGARAVAARGGGARAGRGR